MYHDVVLAEKVVTVFPYLYIHRYRANVSCLVQLIFYHSKKPRGNIAEKIHVGCLAGDRLSYVQYVHVCRSIFLLQSIFLLNLISSLCLKNFSTSNLLKEQSIRSHIHKAAAVLQLNDGRGNNEIRTLRRRVTRNTSGRSGNSHSGDPTPR